MLMQGTAPRRNQEILSKNSVSLRSLIKLWSCEAGRRTMSKRSLKPAQSFGASGGGLGGPCLTSAAAANGTFTIAACVCCENEMGQSAGSSELYACHREK